MTSPPQPDLTERTGDAPLVFDDADQEIPEQLVLTEIDAIHQRLIEDAKSKAGSAVHWETTRLERMSNIALVVAGGGLGLFMIEALPVGFRAFLAVIVLIAMVVSPSAMAIGVWRDWQNRRVATMQELTAVAYHERQLVHDLLRYSRPALLHVAASARALDQRITQRLAFVLGPNRANGLLGALFLILGIFSAGKYLQESRVAIPILNTAITSSHVLTIAAYLFFFTVMLLFAGARVSGLNPTAELLERVAALKKNLEEEQKNLGGSS